MASGKKRPSGLEKFRFTSQRKDSLDALLGLYGGTLNEWEDAPAGKQWELLSDTTQIRVLVPPEEMSLSQNFELWSGGGCQRRCDGREQQNGEQCACDPDNRSCKLTTRVSVLLEVLPSSGMWRLETHGEIAGDEIAAAFDLSQLVKEATGKRLLPATIILEQRQIKVEGKTKNFPVPVLNFDVPATVIEPSPRLASGVIPIPALPPATLAEALDAMEEPATPRARTASSAEPVKSTGLKPHALTYAVPDPENPQQFKVVPPETTTDGKSPFPDPDKYAEVFDPERVAEAKAAVVDDGTSAGEVTTNQVMEVMTQATDNDQDDDRSPAKTPEAPAPTQTRETVLEAALIDHGVVVHTHPGDGGLGVVDGDVTEEEMDTVPGEKSVGPTLAQANAVFNPPPDEDDLAWIKAHYRELTVPQLRDAAATARLTQTLTMGKESRKAGAPEIWVISAERIRKARASQLKTFRDKIQLYLETPPETVEAF